MKARIIALAMGLLVVSHVAVAAPPPVPDIPGHASKLSIYIAKGAANSCGQGCDRWIAVEGKVDVGAAARIRQFLRKTKSAESLPFYFHSPGGAFRDGLAIGRMLRARNAVARVAKTIVGACAAGTQIDEACLKLKNAGGELEATLMTRGAMCNSACSYLFLGATTREVAPDAALGVHSSRIILRFTGNPTPRQQAEVMANRRSQSNQEASSFVKAMGISHELVELIRTIAFESGHVLTRQELYRFGIDKRELVETGWALETKARPFVQKFALLKKANDEFRTLEWRLYCEPKDRARLMFIRQFDKGAGASSIAMVAGSEKPLTFGTHPARVGAHEAWIAVIKSDAVKDLFAEPRLQVGESASMPDGKTTKAMFEIDTQGLDNAWTQLSATCLTKAPAATPAVTAPAVPVPAANR
ncbi:MULTISPECIES: hypothetical protein [unclassified Afipia]|uniref:COG3904 family protein n=1 Tax=unclassified Afipia TaxID=2642050 RepID=UPI0004098655|nr:MULTISPECIES: hypothetical protein [unclassified Afipia]